MSNFQTPSPEKVLIGILILAGIPFTIRAEKIGPEITLISVYDNYQVDQKLKTAWGFATIIKTHQELILLIPGETQKFCFPI